MVMKVIVLEGKGLGKSYDGEKIIENVSLEVKKGEIVCLLGVSGVGKSTLFNILSGLETPDEGEVLLEGEAITGVPGKIGYMQQSDLLLPFKSIIRNVMTPLLLKKKSKAEARGEAEAILKEFMLGDYMDMYPCKLSGGMRQRAALARTFLTGCAVMLLDEPFSALDAITRRQMQTWFRSVTKKHELSAVFITHDIDEALILSDRIYILSGSVGTITDEIAVDIKDREDNYSDTFIKLRKEIIEKVK